MPTITTHITQYSSQKSYAEMLDLEHTGAFNLLKNQTGRVYNILMDYDHSTVAYVKMYDSKGLTHGTTEPIFVVPVIVSGFKQSIMSQSGIKISSGCAMAASNLAGRGNTGGAPTGTVNVFISGS